MRFSANTLRLLQEDLAPAMPQLAAPPEMVNMPHLAVVESSHVTHAAPCSRFSFRILAPCYVSFAALACALWYLEATPYVVPFPVLIAAHALGAKHSPIAQGIGLMLVFCFPFASVVSLLFPVLSIAAFIFFALAAPGGDALKVVTVILIPLGVSTASLLCIAESGQAKSAAAAGLCAALCLQATVSAWRLGTLEICVKPFKK
jgi:hypothetical protein